MAIRTTDRDGQTAEIELGCALSCDCWDCRSWRRHLVRVSLAVLLACVLGGELGWQAGWWRAGEPVPAGELDDAPGPPGELS